MRSFGSRADCAVWDEPFFAPYLDVSGVPHPGRDETLEQHETDPREVAKRCAASPRTGEPYFFQKHMPHHMLPDFPLDWAKNGKHFFLIREPARVIASYVKGRAEFTLEDLGFAPQRQLLEKLTRMTGSRPPIIDSVDILRVPETMLRALCKALDIPFDPAMLQWEAGPRPEDGAWAPYWYKSVERSEGFGPPPENTPDVPEQYQDLLEQCEQDYAVLYAHRIKV